MPPQTDVSKTASKLDENCLHFFPWSFCLHNMKFLCLLCCVARVTSTKKITTKACGGIYAADNLHYFRIRSNGGRIDDRRWLHSIPCNSSVFVNSITTKVDREHWKTKIVAGEFDSNAKSTQLREVICLIFVKWSKVATFVIFPDSQTQNFCRHRQKGFWTKMKTKSHKSFHFSYLVKKRWFVILVKMFFRVWGNSIIIKSSLREGRVYWVENLSDVQKHRIPSNYVKYAAGRMFNSN